MRRLGFEWLTDWEIRTRRDADLTATLLANTLQVDTVCIDVGANKGDFLEQFVRLAPRAQHLAFEPIPQHAKTLAKRYPGVQVFETALSDHSALATFYFVPNRDAWSGLKKQRYPNKEEAVEIKVALQKLDDVIDPDTPVGFIKIDVEGAEYEVLRGAVETIRRCRPILLFEHAKLHNENYRTTPEMLFDLLNDTCDMRIYDLGLSHVYDRKDFADIYERSYASRYDCNAQTNFVARPEPNQSAG